MPAFRLFVLTAVAVCSFGLSQAGFAEEALAIITKRDSALSSLPLETIKLVYLRKLLLDDNNNRWIPLNLSSTHELRQIFSLLMFKKLPEDLEEYWNEQYFQGVSPPQVLASEEAVLRFVAMTPGALGYVRMQNVDDRVKVLKTIAIPEHK